MQSRPKPLIALSFWVALASFNPAMGDAPANQSHNWLCVQQTPPVEGVALRMGGAQGTAATVSIRVGNQPARTVSPDQGAKFGPYAPASRQLIVISNQGSTKPTVSFHWRVPSDGGKHACLYQNAGYRTWSIAYSCGCTVS